MFLHELNKILINVYYSYLNDVIGGYVIRALFGLFIVVTTLTNSILATTTTDKLKSFITGINNELATRNNKRMFVITVTRHTIGKAQTITTEQFDCIFNAISYICSGKGFAGGHVSELPRSMEAISLDPSDMVYAHSTNKIEESAAILIFNEMFFSQYRPLTADEMNSITTQLIEFSKGNKNVVIYPNFLFLGKEAEINKDVMRDFIAKTVASISDLSMQINPAYAFHVKKKLYDANSAVSSMIGTTTIEPMYNKTICIHDGQILLEYLKSTYFQESDADFANESKNCWYLFGDGNITKCVPSSELATFLGDNVSLEICFDLANGIAMKHNIGSSIHILQSNWIDPTNYLNQTKLLKDRLIIHCDTTVTNNKDNVELCKSGNILFRSEFDMKYQSLTNKVDEFKINIGINDNIVIRIYTMEVI